MKTKIARRLAIALGAYLALVLAVETLVPFLGKRAADRGLREGEAWLVLTTTDRTGGMIDTVLYGAESDGEIYVSANHWPRSWYKRAVANPDVRVLFNGATSARRAVPVVGEELERVKRDYSIPLAVRIMTGFPPRSFLRLDPLPPMDSSAGQPAGTR